MICLICVYTQKRNLYDLSVHIHLRNNVKWLFSYTHEETIHIPMCCKNMILLNSSECFKWSRPDVGPHNAHQPAQVKKISLPSAERLKSLMSPKWAFRSPNTSWKIQIWTLHCIKIMIATRETCIFMATYFAPYMQDELLNSTCKLLMSTSNMIMLTCNFYVNIQHNYVDMQHDNDYMIIILNFTCGFIMLMWT